MNQSSSEMAFGTRLTYEQKENIKLLSSKFVNKYVRAEKRNYCNHNSSIFIVFNLRNDYLLIIFMVVAVYLLAALLWNPRVITIRDNKFQFYKLNMNFNDLRIDAMKAQEELRARAVAVDSQQAQRNEQEQQEMNETLVNVA